MTLNLNRKIDSGSLITENLHARRISTEGKSEVAYLTWSRLLGVVTAPVIRPFVDKEKVK